MRKNDTDPVHAAVMVESLTDLVRALNSGAAVDARDREGRTALFYAVMDGSVAITAELLRHGADPSAHDRHRETPLHFAAREYQLACARLLLDAGAPVDAQDSDGNTPLWRAVFESEGRGEMIELLLAHGADRTLKNDHGFSPKSLSEGIANYDVRQFL